MRRQLDSAQRRTNGIKSSISLQTNQEISTILWSTPVSGVSTGRRSRDKANQWLLSPTHKDMEARSATMFSLKANKMTEWWLSDSTTTKHKQPWRLQTSRTNQRNNSTPSQTPSKKHRHLPMTYSLSRKECKCRVRCHLLSHSRNLQMTIIPQKKSSKCPVWPKRPRLAKSASTSLNSQSRKKRTLASNWHVSSLSTGGLSSRDSQPRERRRTNRKQMLREKEEHLQTHGKKCCQMLKSVVKNTSGKKTFLAWDKQWSAAKTTSINQGRR